ncbi:di-heme oxidoredictase family protein [Halioxenophilus sp. WMMB6]|uniref:di-heme oxidoredictase family protein n=1 Tax=Halioxenophilus sp. WMMB6 TaxID=3073815 RepID=UPI00295F49A3|nr:di-heme oxidoredictase family protein [Halioxenophilus sp. WMMB6]
MRYQTMLLTSALGVILLALTACGGVKSRNDQPLADQRNLIDDVRYSQDDINQGNVAFEDLFYAGKHIFSNRFTAEDHYGEHPQLGPRTSNYKLFGRPGYPFLRFNGLDSQSCLECHLAAGFAPQKNYLADNSQIRFAKQPGFTGGGAGFASNAFGLADFACSAEQPGCEPQYATRGIIRNPPHAFGAGYTQSLAEEMSWDLQEKLMQAQANPGTEVELITKGISFGRIKVLPDGTLDTSMLEGISKDLTVRPFQWRGIASNLRNFVRDAMNFHFSVQPAEFLRDHPDMDDNDSLYDEILEGEVTAVATYLAFLRPPVESSKGLDAAQVSHGRVLFEQVGCSSCHVPSLTLNHDIATIRDPRMDQSMTGEINQMMSTSYNSVAPKIEGDMVSRGYFITAPYGVPPTIEKFVVKHTMVEKMPPGEVVTSDKLSLWLQQKLKGYNHTLSFKKGPPETQPRLPNSGDQVEVPLYSDLKRHQLGNNLAEPTKEPQKDDGGNAVADTLFLTRPLWGVADTAPWMHDGRALSLDAAIKMHKGEASEANGSIDSYLALAESEQEAIRAFLSSLRLPVIQ